MKNRFDIIITTYNREESLKILISDILKSTILPHKIIIVDSSSKENISIQKYSKVKYIKSSHPNQPYQRYLGQKLSTSNILIFMDDDMRILQKNAFEKILQKYNNHNIIGVQPNFINNNDFLQKSLPKSKINFKDKTLNRWKRILTGYYIPKSGQLSFCGIRGEKPKNESYLQYFNGGVFSVKRECIFSEKFNAELLTIFENKLGMGEDTILGYEASKFGKIIYIEESLFLHDDQKNSTYSLNTYSYAKRVAYSRLFLSLEYQRLKNSSSIPAFLHYQWYMFWRILNLFINSIISKNKNTQKEMLKGFIFGWIKGNLSIFDFINNNKYNYWKKELENDIKKKQYR